MTALLLLLLLGLIPAFIVHALREGLPSDARLRSEVLLSLAALFIAWTFRTLRIEASTAEYAMALTTMALASGLTWRIPGRLQTWSIEIVEGVLVLLGLLTALLDGDRHTIAVQVVSALIVAWAILGTWGALRGLDVEPHPRTTFPLAGSVLLAASSLLLGMNFATVPVGPSASIAVTAILVAVALAIETKPDPKQIRIVSTRALVGAGAIGGALWLSGHPTNGSMLLPMIAGALCIGLWSTRRPDLPAMDREEERPAASSDPMGMERETLVVLERLADPLASEADELLPSPQHMFPGARMELLRNPDVTLGHSSSAPVADAELLAVVSKTGMIRSDSIQQLSLGIRKTVRQFGPKTVLLPVTYDETVHGILVVRDLELAEGTFSALRRFSDLLAHRLENQRLYTALQHKQRLADLGTFAAALVHDLRSPLSTVRLEVELLQLSVGEQEQESLANIILAIDRVLADLSGTLDFTRALDLDLAPVDLRQLLGKVVESSRLQEGSDCVGLHADDELGRLEVRGDSARLLRVFENLVRNGLEVSHSGNPVRIEVERENRGVLIKVVDRGDGIDPTLRDRIFEPFVTSKSHGMGLGLAIVHKIIEAHQGHVVARSGPGGGTSMQVWLPLASKTAPPIIRGVTPRATPEPLP